jgi:hypothetical protein
MKRGRQGERTDLKTDDDRARNRTNGSKGGRTTKARGRNRSLTPDEARDMSLRRWKKDAV